MPNMRESETVADPAGLGFSGELMQPINDFKRLSSHPPSLFFLETPGSSERVII